MASVFRENSMLGLTNGVGKTGYLQKTDEIGSLSYTTHKTNSKCVKGLKRNTCNYRTCRRKEKKLLNIGFDKVFLDMTPKAQAIKPKTNNWDYLKLKIFCVATEREKIFANYVYDNGLILKYIRNYNSIAKKTPNNLIKKRTRTRIDVSPTIIHVLCVMKRCSTSLMVRDMQNHNIISHLLGWPL